MGNPVFRRKIYKEILEWKEERSEKYALLIKGARIAVEVLPLTNYVRSADEHQHHLERFPEDGYLCHIPDSVLNKFRTL